MDESRYRELTEKRDSQGLTRDEADELGRLMAEREGEEYRNVDNPPPDVAAERDARTDVTEEDVTPEEAEAEPKGSEERPEEERRAGPPKPGTEGPPPA